MRTFGQLVIPKCLSETYQLVNKLR